MARQRRVYHDLWRLPDDWRAFQGVAPERRSRRLTRIEVIPEGRLRPVRDRQKLHARILYDPA